jgi:hypothetical protein
MKSIILIVVFLVPLSAGGAETKRRGGAAGVITVDWMECGLAADIMDQRLIKSDTWRGKSAMAPDGGWQEHTNSPKF